MGQRGFTLVETLVVVFIVLLLAGALLYNTSGFKARALEAQAASHGGVVAQAVQGYLATYITETPEGLMDRIEGFLAPDTTGAPPRMLECLGEVQPSDHSCAEASTSLPTGGPVASPGPGAPECIGCLFGVRSVGKCQGTGVHSG